MARSSPPLEAWAGIECTRTRIGNRSPDQLERTGHRDRLDDLDRLATLGVKAVRYPLLWEHVVEAPGAAPDWSWPDERLPRLRELGIRPVVGLLHHGAGPDPRGFQAPDFVERFVEYARAVAERFPWVTEWLPINEPLTTARFCGLYGVWQPHARDDRVFAHILEVQLRATVLAMRAIREVNPYAQLVQNEDVGTILAVPRLRDQAAYENERRWVTYDLLTGQLEPGMRMWKKLRASGLSERQLRWFQENPCPPDVLAIDQYLTSDRLLDDRMHRYPARAHGGNGERCYADIEAVRATESEPPGLLPVLREAWQRYGRTLAIGEAHLGSTRDEQIRWLRDVWRIAELVRSEGVDLRAVTFWATFGSYDWNTLLVEENGWYEPGAFDLRVGTPRPTAVARVIRSLADGETPDHPALDTEGWWRRDVRLLVPPVRAGLAKHVHPRLPKIAGAEPRQIALSGTMLPQLDAFERICASRNLPTVTLPREHLAIEAADALQQMRAWAVIDVSGCATAHPRSRSRTGRTRTLARACRDADVPLLIVACHHVLTDPQSPCSEAELDRIAVASEIHDRVLVLRTGALLDPWDRRDPLVRHLATGARMPLKGTIAPSYLPDIVHTGLDLLVDEEDGDWDLHHGVECRWSDLEDAVAAGARGADPVLPVRPVEASNRARMLVLPSVFDAVTRFLAESEQLWRRDALAEPEVVELDAGPGLRFPATEPADTMAPAEDVLSSADGAA